MLPQLGLALDSPRAEGFGFVSHAHADHFARHRRILCSPATAQLLRARFRVAASRLEPLPFGEPVEHAGHLLTLHPAGHVVGSAMLHVRRVHDGESLLYTGDFKLRESRTAGAARPVEAGTLVIETTFGEARYVFPPRAEIEERVVGFVRDALADGLVPVLAAYSLGKAQEALAVLAEHGIPALASASVREMSVACGEAGLEHEPPGLLDGLPPAGTVAVVAPGSLRSQPVAGWSKRRVAMLSGWGLNPSARFRYRVDEVIPMSDHADHPQLLEMVARVAPRRVVTVHGSTREFAAELRRRGIEAWSDRGGDQLELF